MVFKEVTARARKCVLTIISLNSRLKTFPFSEAFVKVSSLCICLVASECRQVHVHACACALFVEEVLLCDNAEARCTTCVFIVFKLSTLSFLMCDT